MDIKNFLLRKKRELSSNSTDGDDRKRPRETSSFDDAISKAANNGEVFKEGLKSDDCVAILCNCMKNLEEKMNELFQITSSAKDSQIKGKLQLKDLNEAVNFISTKFDEYEKERKEREQIIKNLEENVSVMNKKVEKLEKEIDKHEQYSHRNCLLVHEIAETDDEVTDDLVIETILTKMNVEISPEDLDQTHRIGKKKAGQNKPRPIIVKLSRNNVRKKVFSNKKNLKGSNISITESLTPKRMEILKKARVEHAFTNVWTSDGKILYKSSTENRFKSYYE